MYDNRLRRPRLTYANVVATLALTLAMSMGGAYAHGKIGSADIKVNAVKSKHIAGGAVKTSDLGARAVGTGKLKASSVTRGKLAPKARTNIVLYTAAGFDFSSNVLATIVIPNVTAAQVANSSWTVQLRSPGGFWFNLNGRGIGGSSEYRFAINDAGTLQIARHSGAGEEYDAIRVFRSERTVTGASGLPVS